MNILLIQSPLEPEDSAVVPIGLCYISSVLKGKGCQVVIFDPNISDRNFDEEIKEILRADAYDLVGISMRNVDNNVMNNPAYYYARLQPMLEQIHELQPAAGIMIGGAGFSIFAETIMKRHPLLDFGIYLEGHETVCDLVAHMDHPERVKGLYYRKENQVFFTGQREHPDLDDLPAQAWRQVDIKKYLNHKFSVGVISKTGCIFNCSYCTYPTLNGRQFSIRSPKLIVDEIETLVKEFDLKEFFFVDSMFNYPVDHAMEVCREMVRRKIKINWSAYFIERYFTKEFMELAMASGCECFSFSPDGPHDKSMKALGKMNSEKDLYKTYEMIKDRKGAKGGYNFFINPPGQDFTGFVKLLKFFFKTRILNRKSFVSCSVWYPRVYPYTPLHRHVVKVSGFPKDPADLLPEDEKKLRDLFWINPENQYINYFYKFVVTPKAWVRKFIER